MKKKTNKKRDRHNSYHALVTSKKITRTWENKRQKHKKKKLLQDHTHPPVPLPTPWCKSNTPYLIHPIIISYTYIMGKKLLVQMRQSNKCGNVKNDEIPNLHLGSGVGPWVSIPCLLQDPSLIYWFHPPKELTRKAKNPEMQLNFQQIILYCLGLCIQNPGLSNVGLKPSLKRRNDVISMLK